MRTRALSLLLAVLLPAGAALAAGGTGSSEMPAWTTDPVIDRIQGAVARKDWRGAAQIARNALGGNPLNADYHNLYAYAVRNGANPAMDIVFKHYNEALRIEPKHRGAHEYLGEAYLMTGNLAKAKEHLSALDSICTFGCEEFTMLKKAIAAHEAGKK